MDKNINKNKDFISAEKLVEEAVAPEIAKLEEKESLIDFIVDIVKFTVIALIIVWPIRYFIAQPFIVSGASMDPTFHDGNYLIIDEISYRMNEPERGDVIVFRYPKDESKYFIKRIIGLPGETVTIKKDEVTITSPEIARPFTIDESYIQVPFSSDVTQKLGEDEYFVMGDNRNNSLDSRMWGPLPKKDIIGRALVRLFPLNAIGLFPGK